MTPDEQKQISDLITNIISDIENDRVLLSQILVKAQRISQKTGNKHLRYFIKKEIEGYKENDTLPQYRIRNSSPIAIVQYKFQMIIKEIPIEYGHGLEKDGIPLVELNKRPIYFSIPEMENFLKESELKELRISFTPDQLEFARQHTESNVAWILKDAYFKLPYGTFPQIMIIVKKNLIDLLLKIESDINIENIPQREGFFEEGTVFDASIKISDFIKKSKKELILIDNFVTEKTLQLFSIKNSNVTVKILTTEKFNNKNLKLFIDNFNAQYGQLEVRNSNKFHDRFLIIDRNQFFQFGSSIKDVGKKTSMFTQINEDFIKGSILKKFNHEWNNNPT
jgi:hypothetical protein